ncbi:MAG: hypothetical protein GW911_04885 [Armatimonadetes bacterium]|nr:hypothetical protein [Armatimonadota bacterium]NCO93345.1 hypothetical protein [Armatimonadota bacterium]NCP30216.1 hypothetical protein [Armatimonadota bacterium]NCQ28436.1 hypothetical protein [Armatimonadota bacterium]NDK11375.1 hypothetical protein [Armatimonadota bacterium]
MAELPKDEKQVIAAEQLHDKEYRAVMIDGYHHAKVKLTRFDDERRKEMVDLVEPAIVGKATEISDPATGEKHYYRLSKLRSPKFLVTMILRQPRAPADQSTKALSKRLKREGAVMTDQLERFYQGTLRVVDPPEVLQQKVRELFLLDTPKYLTAEVEWIVDKRRIAMLLFRQ